MPTKKYLIVCGGSGKYVLGQRKVLGLDGEIQIDVTEEINLTRKELSLDKDNLSLSVKADICSPNVGNLLTKIPEIAEAQGWGPDELKHATFIQENFLGSPALKDGMAQSAAIGGLAILHPDTQTLLGARLSDMLTQTANADVDLEFWIISSTSGGTGEGIHRAVSDKIIEVTKNSHSGSKKIKHIRIGKSTYTTIGKARATIQTLLGICADAKFPEKMRNKYGGKNATFNWYYIDLPDYGKGNETKRPRGRMISLAAKALMIPELVEPLQLLESNANTAIIRTGYWGHEYDDEDLYNATLSGFILKLENLINPKKEDLFKERSQPEFEEGETFQQVLKKLTDGEQIIPKLEDGWSISKEKIAKDISELDAYLNDNVNCMNNLFGDFLLNELELQDPPKYMTQVNLANNPEPIPFRSDSKPSQNKDWYEIYRNAQSVVAWVNKELGLQTTALPNLESGKSKNTKRSWYSEGGLLDKLFKKHNECKDALKGGAFKNNANRAKSLVKVLSEYSVLLMKCRILFDEYSNAVKLIAAEEKPNKILVFAKIRQGVLTTNSTNGSRKSVITADLMDVLDHLNGKTWFDLVLEATQKNLIEEFKSHILKGAVVLTYEGLKEVLGLPQNASDDDIKLELNDNVGRMFDKDGKKIQALWMCNQDPRKVATYAEFVFRLLPRLAEGLKERIGQGENDAGVSYHYPPLGVLGLYVLALEGLTVATQEEMVFTPAFLIKPLIPELQGLLKDWRPHKTGKDSPRIKIALAGVVGDSLPLDILHEAGLKPDETEKLKEYYMVTNFGSTPVVKNGSYGKQKQK